MITNVANGPYYEIVFMFGHGQISNQFFDDIMVSSIGIIKLFNLEI